MKNFSTVSRWLVIVIGITFTLALSVTSASAIIKGADGQEFAKYTVMVLDDRGEMCSAVILSKTVILTAAHCIAGAHDWRVHWRDQEGAVILVKPKGVKIHPSYVPDAVAKRRSSIDLAILTLRDPLPEVFEPVALSDEPGLDPGEQVTVAGFGFSEEKNRKTLGKIRSATLTVVQPFGPGKFVLWMEDGSKAGSGACQGDSGGPIFYKGKLVAVTSWSSGKGRANCGEYSQGVFIYPELQWLSEAISKN